MSRHDIEHLLDRYLKGETTAKENELVDEWLAENDNINTEWQNLDQPTRQQWLNSLFSDIENTISADNAKVVVMQPRTIWWRSVAAVAAILAIFFTLFLEWPAIQNKLHPQQLITLTVPSNKKQQISLADGSKVWINASAQLKYPKVFNNKVREVYLSGEAYFDIKHDASKPFIVHTGDVVTTVLGTAFNINADKNSNTIIVTVTRGKVSVIAGKHLLGFVIPNQQITYNTLNNQHTQTTVNADEVIAWQQGDLQFDDITFEEAAKQLRQRFNVNVSFTNEKVKNCRFSGTALKGKNIDQVLKVICAFNNASYTHLPDGSILIDGKGCN
jgi:transmembrane sensor